MIKSLTGFLYSLGISALVFCSSVQSIYASATLNVSAVVQGYCTIGAVTSISFGNYVGAPMNGSTTVPVTCTNGLLYQLLVGQGLHPQASSTDAAPVRQMNSGSNLLQYNLYQDSGALTVWGNTTAAAPAVATGTGAAQSITVYAKIPGGQNVTVGNYSDTVNIIIVYN